MESHTPKETPDPAKTDRIRLALVITELAVGGAEKCLVNLATNLAGQGSGVFFGQRHSMLENGLPKKTPDPFALYEPVVYSLQSRPPEGKDLLVRQLEAAGVSVKFLDLRSSWQFFGAVRHLTALLKEQKPQIVQTFLFHANVVGAMAARKAAVPKVVAGIRVADPRWWRTWLERRILRRADAMVCVSASVAEFCRRRHYRATAVVIPNGVDLSKYENADPLDLTQLGLAPGRRAIVYVGRLDPQKGLREFLQAAPEGMQALAQHDLVLVGDGPQRQELTQLVKKLGIAHRVYFAGWRADVPAILAAAEMLVLPSRYEGMPNVVLEAMAAGKPVVATEAEGVRELLGQAADKQIVPLGDYREMWNRIHQLAQLPQLLAELSSGNRLRAKNEFSLAAMVARYDRLYRSLACGSTQENCP